MKFIIPLFALLTVFFSPLAHANDDGKLSSYHLKKQGKVHFTDRTEDNIAAQDQYPQNGVQNIEPAAGVETNMEPQEQKSELADKMRLPRKSM